MLNLFFVRIYGFRFRAGSRMGRSPMCRSFFRFSNRLPALCSNRPPVSHPPPSPGMTTVRCESATRVHVGNVRGRRNPATRRATSLRFARVCGMLCKQRAPRFAPCPFRPLTRWARQRIFLPGAYRDSSFGVANLAYMRKITLYLEMIASLICPSIRESFRSSNISSISLRNK